MKKRSETKQSFFFERMSEKRDCGLDGLVVRSVLDGLFVGWFVARRDEGWVESRNEGWVEG
jgi:hypothetical protein